MKVLFVCSGNIGRSQMAMEYFKRFSSEDTSSAGTHVTVENERIGDRGDAQVVLEAMREDGIDMADNQRTTLTSTLADQYDRVVSMAELDRTPDWLKNSSKFEHWDTINVNGLPLEKVREVRNMIKSRVRKLTLER